MSDAESGAGCDVCKMNCMKEENLLGMKKWNYGFMCKPTLMPWCIKEGAPPPTFFDKDAKLPLLLSLLLGFQHALAMLAGIATSGGYLITNDTCFSFQRDSQMCDRMPWMISVAWLTSGILTIVQVFRAKIIGTPFYLGTGLISVMGTSFTFLPIARTMTLEGIAEAKAEWPKCAVDGSGSPVFTGSCCWDKGTPFASDDDCYGAGAVGYGRFLGTALVAALFEVLLALMPPKVIKTLFPPVVTGASVMLIGGGLIAAGIKYVGGGVFCAENTESKAATAGWPGEPQLCFGDNGEVAMAFGSVEYVGLAMSVVLMSIIIQIFGSPFLKSTFLLWSLCFGCIVASGGKDGKSYFRSDFLEKGKAVTFLWAEGTFPIGFSGVNFPLILIGFIVSSAETIGDVEMTCIYSKVDDEADRASRIQGGLLADGVNSFFACLFGSPPNTTFSQNNGLIALTRCASRSAGFSCAFWLICLGLFGKFGAAFASIPICVVGGLVLQCFASVFVSGMRIATLDWTRRNQFILMLALGLGLGVAMEGHIIDWPGPYSFFRRNLAFDYGFWPERYVCKKLNMGFIEKSSGKCRNVGFFTNGIGNGNCCAEYDKGAAAGRKLVLLILKTPYGIGFFVAFILNLILPNDADDGAEEATGSKGEVTTSSA